MSAIRELQRRIKPPARRKRTQTRKSAERTFRPDGYAFLKQEFKPFYGVFSSNLEKTEADFFISLNNLCALYQWAIPVRDGLTFPENVAHAYQCIQKVAEKENVQVLIVVNDAGVTTLATTKTLGLFGELFYIPIRPYWYISQDKKLEPLFKVMTCIFSYLISVVGVTYYRKDSYVQYMYELLENMVHDSDESEPEEDLKEQIEELENMERYGDELYQVFNVKYHPEQLKALLSDEQGLDADMRELAGDFLKLSMDYPNRALSTNLNYDLLGRANDQIIHEDHYLSFYWSGYDCFRYIFFDWINNDLMEKDGINEPVALQCFDTPQAEVKYDLDFENRLFKYLEILAFTLNAYDQ